MLKNYLLTPKKSSWKGSFMFGILSIYGLVFPVFGSYLSIIGLTFGIHNWRKEHNLLIMLTIALNAFTLLISIYLLFIHLKFFNHY